MQLAAVCWGSASRAGTLEEQRCSPTELWSVCCVLCCLLDSGCIHWRCWTGLVCRFLVDTAKQCDSVQRQTAASRERPHLQILTTVDGISKLLTIAGQTHQARAVLKLCVGPQPHLCLMPVPMRLQTRAVQYHAACLLRCAVCASTACTQHHTLMLWMLDVRASTASPDRTTQALLCMHHLSWHQQLSWTSPRGTLYNCAGYPPRCSSQACRHGQCRPHSCTLLLAA